jgi:hypothetical protein
LVSANGTFKIAEWPAEVVSAAMEQATQATSAAVAQVVTSLALHPLDVIKLRLSKVRHCGQGRRSLRSSFAPLLQGCDENGVPYTSSVDALKRARGPISGICADAARARLAGLLRESGVASLYTGLRSKLLMDIIRTVSFHYTFTALKEVIPRRSIQIARASSAERSPKGPNTIAGVQAPTGFSWREFTDGESGSLRPIKTVPAKAAQSHSLFLTPFCSRALRCVVLGYI